MKAHKFAINLEKGESLLFLFIFDDHETVTVKINPAFFDPSNPMPDSVREVIVRAIRTTAEKIEDRTQDKEIGKWNYEKEGAGNA